MKVKIEINLEDTGAINVTGPLEDKVLMYGLLEVAKTVVASYQVPKDKIVKVPPGAKLFELGKH